MIGIARMYDELLDMNGKWGAGIALVLAGGLLARVVPGLFPWETDEEGCAAPLEERVLMLGFVCLPGIGYVFARLAHGGMFCRYVMPTVLGISLAAAFLTGRKRCAAGWLLAILLSVLVLKRVEWMLHGATIPAVSVSHDHPETVTLEA